MTAIIPGDELIAIERRRQMNHEGWTPEHDDQHTDYELVRAAACYAKAAHGCLAGLDAETMRDNVPDSWPWADEWWKPSADPIRNLEKAGALMAAEIDRIQRAKS